MAACQYCKHRKGKRSCPALAGMICSPCCGQHRLRDIDCPENCVHLGGLAIARGATRADFTKADLDQAWDKLHAYAEKARDFRNEALARVLDASELTQWELDLVTAYLYYGHRGAGGRRLVDLFIAACGRDLPRGEIAAAVALRDAWASLFEIVSVHSGIGLELRELRTGELHRVRELSATAQLQPGDVMFAWVMARADHMELAGLACVIPRQHRERVGSALEAELAVARARWPGLPDRELVGATAWVVADVMREAVRDDLTRQPELSTAAALGPPPKIALDDVEASGDPARARDVTAYAAEQAPDPDEWMAIDESLRLTAIEAHHRALGVTVPPMHALLHLIAENQLAAREPPETRTTLDRLITEGLNRHEAIHAIGSVVATAVWDVIRREAPVDRDAMLRALADLRAPDWHAEPAAARSPAPAAPAAIPPLAHEVMYRLVAGFEAAIERAAEHVRRHGWQDTDILDPETLLKRSNIDEYLFPLGHTLLAIGWDKRAAIQELELLSVHAFNVLSYQLHRRKTFWVDESLAFMLGCTRLDVRGEGLRLPFPSFALVFTDRETLAIAEALAARDPVANVRGRTLRALTIYVTQIPADRGALGLHLTLMLDAGIDQWPWIVTRDLDITPDNNLDEILDSRFPDVQNADPIFVADELRQLMSLIVNTILFATSSPSWPVIAPPPRPPHAKAKPKPRPAPHTHEPSPDRTGEQVWHLPGKIPISQVRALRELRSSSRYGPMFSRFMVRGHWRRAPNTWRDRSARWIEPYWKGPDLGDIVEREYRLQP